MSETSAAAPRRALPPLVIHLFRHFSCMTDNKMRDTNVTEHKIRNCQPKTKGISVVSIPI
ncbi:hypothetical protein KP806_04540 [Paenibacillus sp. N4]|uniref:hypothetical protein n=1 Tax=Paenibacillus vietnamensis TaxID=2590547 RepID=UPI001CD14140|nr:hypothetical protein [Paenibacillus vietnamensis]MCA0754305.1 hypothetical protein [Paenibacillus vietnamensis]